MKRLVKFVLGIGAVAAVVAYLKGRPAPPSASPTAPPHRPGPSEAPVVADRAAIATEPTTTWVEPAAGGGCPDGFPVKAKMGTKIFHVEGGALYERTVPDRCYATAEAAEADGLRASKR